MAGNIGPGAIKKIHQLDKSVAPLTDQVIGRDPHIVEINGGRVRTAKAHLAVHRFGLVSLPVCLYDNNAVPAGLGRHLWIGQAKHQQKGADSSVADHDLASVNDPFIAIQHCSGGRRGRIAARIRFGNGKAHDGIAFKERRQPFFLLLLCPVKQEFFSTKSERTQLLADARVHFPEFLQNQRLFKEAQSRPSVFFRDEKADQIQCFRFFYDVGRKGPIYIEIERYISKFTDGKLSRRFLYVFLLFGKIKIHAISPYLVLMINIFLLKPV